MKLPKLKEISMAQLMTTRFGGLNHNLRIGDGEWYLEKNLSAAEYPLFSQRGKRGLVTQVEEPQGMLAKDSLAYVAGGKLYYNGNRIEGLELSAEGEKQLVSMGAYLLIFPDQKYINTQDLTEYGSMNAAYESGAGVPVQYSLCREDGTDYNVPDSNIGGSAPQNPANGTYWIDTSGEVHVLKQYSAAQESWVDIPTAFVRIGCPGIGKQFSVYDGVNISGAAVEDNSGVGEQVEALNGDMLLYAAEENYIVVAGMLDRVATQTEGTLRVERKAPEMQYVCEGENRVWGCYYGMRNGKTVNEIYACALGDFKNWRRYMGISTDSYAVSVGSDGPFTGAIHYGGYPHFFKETCLHKLYGTAPENYSMQTVPLRGVQDGSWRSMRVVNEVLYYKSRTGVCAFDGSIPADIGINLGGVKYYDAAAGSFGERYYISMRSAAGEWQLFTYDTQHSIWHMEDETHALCFEQVDDELYCLTADGRLLAMNGTQGTLEDSVEWLAQTGIMGYEYADHKYLSRYNLRMKLGAGARAAMYIEYDSSGRWELQGEMRGTDITRTFMLPVIPRRCDHLRLKLEGVGDVKLYSIARMLSIGGDGR